jgi:hypothetical protein
LGGVLKDLLRCCYRIINHLKDDKYLSSKQNIMTAATDGFEHSITLGKMKNGTITQAPMNSGNQQYMVSTNS